MPSQVFIRGSIALVFIFYLGACKKDQNNEQSEFKVLEYNTAMPVEGAIVEAYKCTSKDLLGNCLNVGSLLSTTSSDGGGKVYFPGSLDVGTLRIKKDRYWPHENPNPGFSPESYVTPIATLRVHITRVNPYPAGYILNVTGQPEACNDCVWETKHLLLPADTVVYLKGGGYYYNTVGWYMNPGGPATGNSTPPVMVSRFDTAQFEISY